MANPGLISRDLLQDGWTPLQDLTVKDILGMLRAAAGGFMTAELPVGGRVQSPADFVVVQCATTGLPQSLCRQNMAKIEAALLNMAAILDGLTGGLDLDVLDTGYGLRDGHVVSYAPKARRFGAVLPANSPGVHALWLPALALKMPLALKPGQREPWTPLRIIESLRAAGFPEAALGFYPSGHDGAGVILRKCGAAMIFGSGASVRPWLGDPRIEIHGPGYSKVLLGPDKADAWRDYLDLIVTSVSSNGGRSCINASSVRTAGPRPRVGRGPGRAPGPNPAAISRRRRIGPLGRLSRSGHGPRHRCGDRARAGPGRRRGRFGPLPRTAAAGRVRGRHVLAADGDLLRRSRSIRWPTRNTCSRS